MEIPANLINEIKRGNVVLFLGAGASMGSTDKDGNSMLGVQNLIDHLSDRFLGGEEKQSSLASVSELSCSESDPITVQIFIKKLFEPYEPAGFHLKVPLFKWKNIFTTNYDLLIEKSYSEVQSSPKKLIPIYSSKDRMDALITQDRDLPYFKLHGCITKIDEHDPPLILTVDQYVTHREKRDSLFERLKSIGSSNTILFVGHSLEDPDVRQILHEVQSITNSRPRYYAVMPEFSEMQSRMWEGKKISLLKGTFEAFLISLEESISTVERSFISVPRSHEIEKKFIKNEYQLTPESLAVIDSNLKYIHSGMSSSIIKPEVFYHGYSRDWAPIQDDLDIPRSISDEIISQVILANESERNSNTELFLIKGSAGAGKSIVLKRVAWDSSIDYDKVCLYWDSNDRINYNVILEVSEKIGERLFLFVDRAASHVPDLMRLLNKLNEAKAPVTCIVSERSNEWNVECTVVHKYLSDDFEVRYLSQKEINHLLDKLDTHSCLGALKGKTRDEQIKAFRETAGRQLLIALHEATAAKSFQEIIHDEYDNIVPLKAQLIYRTVCVMNRLSVHVRAGIIHRLHNVSFEEFSRNFFSPLENVVKVIDYQAAFDHAYEARHPLIAEMVFTHALPEESDKFDAYISLISALDIGYGSDNTAFKELVKFKSLSIVFNDLNNIEKIYDKAYSVCGDDDYYYQQRAIYYMKSARRNYQRAEELLVLAEEFGSHNPTIKHTFAELELLRANNSAGLERERHLNKAKSLATTFIGKNSDSSHGYGTLFKVALSQLEKAVADEDEELITESTKKAEQYLREALQQYPDDEIMLSNEARLAKVLSDSERAFKALQKAFSVNSSSSYVAGRLSSMYIERGDIPSAKEVLIKIIESSPSDKIAHAHLGMLLVRYEPNNKDEIEYHLRRSFTDGDSNHLNQLWYARQLYINNKFDDYSELIQKLKKLNMSPSSRHMVRGIITEPKGGNMVFFGNVKRKEHTFAILETSGFKGQHFLHRTNAEDRKWEDLSVGKGVEYILGFTFAGAAAILK